MITLSKPKRQRGENIVPMINVAFLLLIFFLMTAVIAPSDPVSIDAPVGVGSDSEQVDVVLYVEADGTLWKDGQPNATLQALTGQTVALRVANTLPGATLAKVLGQLKQAGAERVNMVVARP